MSGSTSDSVVEYVERVAEQLFVKSRKLTDGQRKCTIRILRLEEVLRGNGLYPQAFRYNNEGVDLVVYSDIEHKTLFQVIESTNYNQPQFSISSEKMERYIRNLNFFSTFAHPLKTLAVSYAENVEDKWKPILIENNIDTMVFGFQHRWNNEWVRDYLREKVSWEILKGLRKCPDTLEN